MLRSKRSDAKKKVTKKEAAGVVPAGGFVYSAIHTGLSPPFELGRQGSLGIKTLKMAERRYHVAAWNLDCTDDGSKDPPLLCASNRRRLEPAYSRA